MKAQHNDNLLSVEDKLEIKIPELFPTLDPHAVYSNRPLTYLDTAATSLKPKVVIQRTAHYLAYENGSPHRGAHALSVRATDLYNKSKERVAQYLKATSGYEVVYGKNTTEMINLVAESLPPALFEGQSGNEGQNGKQAQVLIPITAHHSNILPWQRLCKRHNARLTYLYVDDQGNFLPGELDKIDATTVLVSVPWISNGLGNVHPVKELVDRAHAVGAVVLIDGAQAVGHVNVDLAALNVDLFVFSAHKVYGPTGIGVLVGKTSLLETFSPYMLGGDMIEYVTEQDASYAPLPDRLEAGTQNVVGAVGLMAAIEWLVQLEAQFGPDYDLYDHEQQLTQYLLEQLTNRADIEVYGPKLGQPRGALVSFNIKGVHPHDVASILDEQGVAIRAGHHCCQPLMHYLKLGATCRASIGAYTTKEDIDALLTALNKVNEVFRGYTHEQ